MVALRNFLPLPSSLILIRVHPMPPRVFQVCDRVYCVMRKSYFTCSYLVTMPDGLVAVDAGMRSHGNDILAAIRHLGRSPAEVKAVVLTHWHNDHSAGAHELA